MRPSVLGDIGDEALHVMTWNVRRPVGPLSWRPADRWSRRRPLLAALLAAERPAILGSQEVVPAQASVISAALGRAYGRIGHGRSPDPRSEGCPIFFDGDRLELLEWRQSALSERPDEAGSRTWGNLVPRVLVVGIFQDRTTGARFAVVNTHLDPFSARSRVRSAERVRETALATGVPVIVTGDANAGIGSQTARALFGTGQLRDAWTAASVRTTPEWATFAGYRKPRRGKRIDWIAVSPGVDVRAAAIDGRPIRGGWPSDHLPVHAAITLEGPA